MKNCENYHCSLLIWQCNRFCAIVGMCELLTPASSSPAAHLSRFGIPKESFDRFLFGQMNWLPIVALELIKRLFSWLRHFEILKFPLNFPEIYCTFSF